MKIISKKKRELIDLCSVLIISITFTLFSLSIGLIDRIYNLFYAFTSLPIAELFINIIFLWLAGLLWITYRRWNEAVKGQRELEDIISSINPDVLIVVDRNRNIIMCNSTVKSMFGYEEDEVVNRKTDFLYSDRCSNPLQKNEISEKLELIGFHSGFAEGKKKNGDIIPLEIITGKLRGREGAVLLIKNITDRKLVEKELEETKDHLNDIIESSLDGIMVTDTEGYITKTNNSFMKLLGYEKEELIGKHTAELSPAEDGIYECTTGRTIEIEIESHYQSQIIIMERLYENGKIQNVVNYYVRKDKKLVPVETNIVLLYNGKGDITGAVGINRDITERKKFEESLKMSEEKYRSLIENANDAVVSMDEEFLILDFNKKAEEMFGYSRDEVMGKSILILTTPSEREKGIKQIEAFRKDHKLRISGTTVEREHLRKDGSIFLTESSSFAVELQGKYVFTLFIRDITERREMEQKLLQSEKLKSLGELAGGVAHDFNNVLAAILGRAQLLKMIVDTPQGREERRKSVIEMKEGLEVIEQASRDGAETVRRIQEFARIRDDDKHFTTVDLNEIIDNALDFTRMKWKDNAESKGIKINIQKDLSTLPTTSGSAAELREVFTNLINNAVDAMPQGGEIKIKTYKEGSHIVINVEDTGVGISRALRGRIFDPFFTTKGVQSTGLGMSVSYGIINRHRGTISVDSSEDQGTTFTIKLPIRERTVEAKEVKPISGEIKKARILVIEDEEGVRNLLSAILKKDGHEVEVVSDGNQGIEIFENKEFDLVFTDLGMPGMSGWQVAEKVKGINRKVPVALITGWNVELNESQMRESGVDLLVYKPFELNQVLRLVQEGMVLKDRFKAA